VQDLLPLHVDGVLRPSTDEFVRDHLLQCKSCEKARDDLLAAGGKWEQYSGKMEELAARLEGEKAFAADIAKWRRRIVWAFVSIVAVISVLSWAIGKFSD
jgi:predicted anti-sigma-YlaC factor YlaD